jgi:hypothetical protein
VAAIVECDDLEARLVQRLHPARLHPVDLDAGAEAVDEQDRHAFAEDLIGDGNAVGGKGGHVSAVSVSGFF